MHNKNNNPQQNLDKQPNRKNNRLHNEIRSFSITQKILPNVAGSVLIRLGNTHVICTASILNGVPDFKKNHSTGWLTAEYSMLPAATHTRNEREAVQGKQSGRTQEIQRLIGRSLRAVTNLKYFANKTIKIDCDVISADGGTRTASITGSYIALVNAIRNTELINSVDINNIIKPIAAISVGIVNQKILLDLDYSEDSCAASDVNVIMNHNLDLIEIQGTAERQPYSVKDLTKMLELAQQGIKQLLTFQKNILNI